MSMKLNVYCFMLLGVFAGEFHLTAGAEMSKRPNVLLLLADDQRADTIHALGNDAIITPNLDKLAEKGFVIGNLFNLGGNLGAICVPSRNMLMTGLSYTRFDKGPRDQGLGPTLPKSFSAAGYQTWYREKSGKANLPYIQKQFDEYEDFNLVTENKTGYGARRIVNDAIEYLESGRDPDRPFLMYLGFGTPHDPRFSAPEFLEMYDLEKIPLPKDFIPIHPWDIGDEVMYIRAEHHEQWPRPAENIRRHIRDYYALITNMDNDIGRLLDKMDELGLRENTIVVFAADQGLSLGSHGMMAKQTLYDSTQRVPCIIDAPGIEPGRTDAMGYVLDMFPTLCDLAGIEVPTGIDGRTLTPLLRREKETVRDHLFLSFKTSLRAVRTERWKLIQQTLINKPLLYDLQADPHEMNNLADDPEYKEVLEKMMNKLRAEQAAYNDTQPLFSDKPAPEKFVPEPSHAKKITPYNKVGGLAPNWEPPAE